MNIRITFGLLALTSFTLALAALPSCSADSPNDQPCNSIPAGGCPLSRGLACEDPACESVYACRANQVWELDHTCPPHEAGAPVDAAVVDAAPEASLSFDASIDAPPGAAGGPGCAPLQTPDCSLAFALSCPQGCCGCEDLFVCQGGGWNYYATCKP